MTASRGTYARRRAVAAAVVGVLVVSIWRAASLLSQPAVASLGVQSVSLRPSPLDPGWRGSQHSVVLAFGGDVHFEGALGQRLAQDPARLFDDSVAPLVGGADLSMVNFESALTNGGCPGRQPKQFVFAAPPTAITAFRAAGITLVTEANNHGEDCGRAGLRQALAIAQRSRYPVIGVGADSTQAFRPYRTVINGQRIAIIAATEVLDSNLQRAWTATNSQPGLASAYDVPALLSIVEAVRATADTVVVYLHWGTETQTCPNPTQPPLARALVKAGADIVVGSHAHVQLGAGYLGSAFVDYGLGNLAFYDSTPPESYSGSLLISVTGRRVDHFRWRPAVIHDGLPLPLPAGDEAATAAMQRWATLRGCTGLTARPGVSRASLASERRAFPGGSRVVPVPPTTSPAFDAPASPAEPPSAGASPVAPGSSRPTSSTGPLPAGAPLILG